MQPPLPLNHPASPAQAATSTAIPNWTLQPHQALQLQKLFLRAHQHCPAGQSSANDNDSWVENNTKTLGLVTCVHRNESSESKGTEWCKSSKCQTASDNDFVLLPTPPSPHHLLSRTRPGKDPSSLTQCLFSLFHLRQFHSDLWTSF